MTRLAIAWGVCLAIGLTAGPVAAQVVPQPPATGRGWGAGRAFNPATLETVQGRILDVQMVPSMGGGWCSGLHLTVQTADGPLAVFAGPEWYLRNQNASLAAGDEVTIAGSRTTWAGQATLIATTIQRGDTVLPLRNPSGLPAWAGFGSGQGGRSGAWAPRGRGGGGLGRGAGWRWR